MGAGMRLISGFSAFAPGSESSRSISSVSRTGRGVGARTTTTGGKGGTPQPRGGQRHWNGPQLLPPARMIHGAAPRPGMRTDQSTGHLPLTLAADHWEREGKRRLPGRWQGLANHQGSPGTGQNALSKAMLPSGGQRGC